MINTEAIIFDMDGVLVNSEKLWKRAEYEIFTSLGVKVTEEYSKLTESMTTSEVTKFWFDKFPWENQELHVVEQMVVSKVIDLIETEECSMNGVKPFIEYLRKQNLKIGLATNSPKRIITTVLNKLDISHLFDAVSSAECEDTGKPHPAIYITTAKKLDVEPKNCIVIEDSYSGMLAAKNAGMAVCAFTNGNKDIHFEIADYKLTTFNTELRINH